MLTNIQGYQAYKKNKYETASPHRLIVMLYEGAIRFANQAIDSIEKQDIEKKNTSIQRFQDIIYELMSCLNFKEGKEIANNLFSLYEYIIQLSTNSNTKNDAVYLQEAITIITEIKEAWEQIGKEGKLHG